MEKTSDKHFSAVSDKHLKRNEFESALIHNEVPDEESLSDKNIILHQHPSNKPRVHSGDNRNSSERGLSSQSRPVASLTQPTRT